MIVTTLFLTPLLSGAPAASPAEDGALTPSFADPVQLTAGGEPLTGILYPSPTLHDVDGDGREDLVIGELFGHITYSPKGEESADVAWGPSRALESGGEPMKLNNW